MKENMAIAFRYEALLRDDFTTITVNISGLASTVELLALGKHVNKNSTGNGLHLGTVCGHDLGSN